MIVANSLFNERFKFTLLGTNLLRLVLHWNFSCSPCLSGTEGLKYILKGLSILVNCSVQLGPHRPMHSESF